MISVENLTKSYGSRLLFDGVGFKLNARERLGLVGRNGHGKTTLFRLICGEEKPDAGPGIVPKQYRIGQVSQKLELTETSVLDEAALGLPAHARDQFWKAEKILSGLGFSPADMQRPPFEFSGGFQVRLNLAKAILSEPDLLLLDEPTNYLDITSIRWIERFLLSWPRELMLITHDRSFMDRIVTHTLGIHRKTLRKIAGNTEKYYAQMAQDEEVYEKTRLNDERRRKEIELFISRFRAKARLANLVQSRVKTLQKMEPKSKLEKIKALDFSFRSKDFNAKRLLQVQQLSFTYTPALPLIESLSFTVDKGDRICIVGPNGKGKTTLLKLLAGNLRPVSGKISTHSNVEIGFYEQTNLTTLIDTRSVEEEILYAAPDVDRQTARNICGAMLFEGDEALKKVAVLSGGEKSRVMLGKLLVTPVNLLLLDEPTNHLDMDSCDALLAAVDNFEGTVAMVTHNEMFLHALARRLIVFRSNRIEVFEGGYQDFLDHGGWEEGPAWEEAPGERNEGEAFPDRLSKKQIRRRRSDLLIERSKTLKPLEQKIDTLENDIDVLEKQLQSLNLQMQSASQTGEGEKIAELSRAMHDCQAGIERLFGELESATVEYDNVRSAFDARRQKLEATVNNDSDGQAGAGKCRGKRNHE
jgi:ATP-binding cassette subfamily F protein 3